MFPAKKSHMKFALIAAVAILAGCQSYRDIAAPVEDPSTEALKSGWCPLYLESSAGMEMVDSGTVCEDRKQAIALRIMRPYIGMRCKKMTYIPKESKWIYGCNAKAKGPAPKPI